MLAAAVDWREKAVKTVQYQISIFYVARAKDRFIVKPKWPQPRKSQPRH